VAKAPFYMLVFGALLTAFYMTRQVAYVFFGYWRGKKPAHESPAVMTVPLAILAFFAMALGLIGTPAWPWFRGFLEGRAVGFDWHGFAEPGLLALMGTSTVVVFLGLGLGWRLYGGQTPSRSSRMCWNGLRLCRGTGCATGCLWMSLYGVTVIAFYEWWARVADWLDRRVWAAWWPGLRGPSVDGRSSTASSITTGSMSVSTKAARSWAQAEDCCPGCKQAGPDLPENSRSGRGSAGGDSDLEQPDMNGFPILTLLTVLPLFGSGDRALVRQAREGCCSRHNFVQPGASACGVDAAAGEWKHRAGGAAPVGAVSGHRVSPGCRRTGSADAGAFSHCPR